MTFDDLDDEEPTPIWEFLAIFCLALAVLVLFMFLQGCGGGDGDDQAQTITIVSGNNLGVDCSDNSQELAAEEEEDDEEETVVVVDDNGSLIGDGDGPPPGFENVPVIRYARVLSELDFVKHLGYLQAARIQECNGGQIIANGVDANVDVQIDEIEEITGETDLTRLLRSGLRIKDGPSDYEEVLEE